MNVRKEDSPADPDYPDAREFLKNRAAISAAILGAGMALGGCAEPQRTGGVYPVTRNGGAKEAWADDFKSWPKSNETKSEEPPRAMGKFRVEPQPDPPPLPGSPPVVPPNPEY